MYSKLSGASKETYTQVGRTLQMRRKKPVFEGSRPFPSRMLVFVQDHPRAGAPSYSQRLPVAVAHVSELCHTHNSVRSHM